MGKADSAFSRQAALYDTTIGWRFVNPLMKQLYGVDAMRRRPKTWPPNTASAAPTRPVRRGQPAQGGGGPGQRRAGREITPVHIPQRKGDALAVAQDEHPRATSTEALARLKGVVRPTHGYRRQCLWRERRRLRA